MSLELALEKLHENQSAAVIALVPEREKNGDAIWTVVSMSEVLAAAMNKTESSPLGKGRTPQAAINQALVKLSGDEYPEPAFPATLKTRLDEALKMAERSMEVSGVISRAELIEAADRYKAFAERLQATELEPAD